MALTDDDDISVYVKSTVLFRERVLVLFLLWLALSHVVLDQLVNALGFSSETCWLWTMWTMTLMDLKILNTHT